MLSAGHIATVLLQYLCCYHNKTCLLHDITIQSDYWYIPTYVTVDTVLHSILLLNLHAALCKRYSPKGHV